MGTDREGWGIARRRPIRPSGGGGWVGLPEHRRTELLMDSSRGRCSNTPTAAPRWRGAEVVREGAAAGGPPQLARQASGEGAAIFEG